MCKHIALIHWSTHIYTHTLRHQIEMWIRTVLLVFKTFNVG